MKSIETLLEIKQTNNIYYSLSIHRFSEIVFKNIKHYDLKNSKSKHT